MQESRDSKKLMQTHPDLRIKDILGVIPRTKFSIFFYQKGSGANFGSDLTEKSSNDKINPASSRKPQMIVSIPT